jgi:hypothetical protein
MASNKQYLQEVLRIQKQVEGGKGCLSEEDRTLVVKILVDSRNTTEQHLQMPEWYLTILVGVIDPLFPGDTELRAEVKKLLDTEVFQNAQLEGILRVFVERR